MAVERVRPTMSLQQSMLGAEGGDAPQGKAAAPQQESKFWRNVLVAVGCVVVLGLGYKYMGGDESQSVDGMAPPPPPEYPSAGQFVSARAGRVSLRSSRLWMLPHTRLLCESRVAGPPSATDRVWRG